MRRWLKRAGQGLFVRRALYPIHFWLYRASLHGMGILNYEDFRVTGEEHFLTREVAARKRGDITVLDVGANEGGYSSRVRALWRDSRIYAFEPHPQTFERLRRRAEQDGYAALNTACGDQVGTLDFFDSAEEDGSSHASLYRQVIEGLHGTTAARHTVAVTTLDAFAAQERIGRIDLLKVDTEGHELKVLLGARRLLAEQRVDIIHFEFNEMNVHSRVYFRDFFELLRGFELSRMLPDGLVGIPRYRPVESEIFAFQNIVAIRRDIL